MTPGEFVREAAELGYDGVIGLLPEANWAANITVAMGGYILLSRRHGTVWIKPAPVLGFDFSRKTNPDMVGAIGPFESVRAALATHRLLEDNP